MASSWTTNNAIELMADGERSGDWGRVTNRNLEIIDAALSGSVTIDLSSAGAAYTLNTTDQTISAAVEDGQHKVLIFSGATEACTITIAPADAKKLYFIVNSSGYTLSFKQGSQATPVDVEDADTHIIYTTGSEAVNFQTSLKSAGITATTAEVNYLDITTLGTSEASKAVTADANGVVTFDNGIAEEYSVVSSSTNVTDIDLQAGTYFKTTLSETTAFTFSNSPATGKIGSFILEIVQDASGSGYAVSWPIDGDSNSIVKWPSANSPTLSTLADAIDVLAFYTYDGGTSWYGFIVGKSMGV